MPTINPYLVFNGNCAEAFEFYRSVFGGEFLIFSRFSELPPEYPMPEGERDKIMHVSLPIGAANILKGSDCPASSPVAVGNNFSVSFEADSKSEADRVFNGLSAGGVATRPMQDVFWGAYFGMCTDKFGINWHVSSNSEAPNR